MIFPDPNLERRPGANEESLRDIIPPTERNQDPAITEAMHGLSGDVARPLTDDEKKAADRDAPVGERVYAPASERVPVDPMPGHREFIDHTDTHTPEREAAGQTPSGSGEPATAGETPPSVIPSGNTYTPGSYDPGASKSFGTPDDSAWNSGARSGGLPFGLLWIVVGLATGIGGWLFVRRRRERNKPINRIRRQARQAADELRDRVPSSPEEAVKPAAGLTTALLSILLILWQQAQARSRQTDTAVARRGKKVAKHAAESVSEVDWQKRLTTLKNRWDHSRLELEKISISRR